MVLHVWEAARSAKRLDRVVVATDDERIRKAGAEHYGEHLGRLSDWVAGLVDLRTRPKLDERDP